MPTVAGGERWHRGRSQRQLRIQVGAVAAAIGLLTTAWWLAAAGDVAGSPHPTRSAGASPAELIAGPAPLVPASPARRASSVVSPEAPDRVRLPSGKVVPVLAVSTRSGRTLDVPDDVFTAGWWRGGSRIGDPFGSVLVAGHVDSRTQGLGRFAELLTVQPDQHVVVTTRHLRQVFEVRSLRLVPQGSLAAHGWISAPTGGPRLTLVTCAPPYVASRGGYQNLAVVTAVPVGGPDRRARP